MERIAERSEPRHSYWDQLEDQLTVAKKRIKENYGDRLHEAVKAASIDPHSGTEKDPYTLSDLHVIADVQGVLNWIDKEHLWKALDLVMTHCQCHCICIDDDPEEVKGLLAKDAITECLREIPVCVIPFEPDNSFSVNFEKVRQKVEEVESKLLTSPQDILLFLLDTNLQGDSPEGMERGRELLREVSRHWPYAFIFAFTKYRDIPVVLSLGQLGADSFIYKPALATLPSQIARFHHKSLGRLVWGPEAFREKDRKADPETLSLLRKHILHWQRMPASLWFGDRVPILVEHCIEHSRNLWRLTESLADVAADVFYKILDENLTVYQAFLLALWLHDIGHKGDGQYQDPPEVRKQHGAISAGLICRRPDLYLPHLPGHVSDRAELVETIGAFCRYHSSSAPLDEDNFDELRQKGDLSALFEVGNMPLLESPNGDLIAPKLPLTLKEDPLTRRRYVLLNDRLRPAVALFRLLDALDMRSNRVGNPYHREIKLDSMRQEMAYFLEKARLAGNRIERELIDFYPHCRLEAEQLHEVLPRLNARLEENALEHATICERRSETPSKVWEHSVIILGLAHHIKEQSQIIKRHVSELEEIAPGVLNLLPSFREWRTILDYLILLFRQEIYFHKHSTFRDVQIAKEDDGSLAVVYELARPIPHEDSEKVLYLLHTAYFCNEALAYVRKEWRTASVHILNGGYNLNLAKVIFSLGKGNVKRRASFSMEGTEGPKELFLALWKQFDVGMAPYDSLRVQLDGLDPLQDYTYTAVLKSEHEAFIDAAKAFLDKQGHKIREIRVSLG